MAHHFLSEKKRKLVRKVISLRAHVVNQRTMQYFYTSALNLNSFSLNDRYFFRIGSCLVPRQRAKSAAFSIALLSCFISKMSMRADIKLTQESPSTPSRSFISLFICRIFPSYSFRSTGKVDATPSCLRHCSPIKYLQGDSLNGSISAILIAYSASKIAFSTFKGGTFFAR